MAKDEGGYSDSYAPKGGKGATYPGGKFPFGAIKSPKETESSDGVLAKTGPTAPAGAAKPSKS